MNALTPTTARLLLAAALLALAAGCRDNGSTASAGKPTSGAEEADHQDDDGHDEEGRDEEHDEEHDEEAAAGPIRLTPEQIQTAAITVTAAGPATIRERLPLYGVIAPNAERVRDITPRFPGVVRSVTKRLGDPVRQGETLATVESNESLQTYALTAPLSGVVTAPQRQSRRVVGRARAVHRGRSLHRLGGAVHLSAGRSRVQRRASACGCRVGETGRRPREGKVDLRRTLRQTDNQTLTARVSARQRRRPLGAGLYVTADVTLAESALPVAVRNEALQILEERTVVFAKGRERFPATARRRLGRSDSEATEVIVRHAGRADRYVATNSFILKAELGKGEAEHEH